MEFARKAADRMMDRVGMNWSDVKYLFMNVPTKHIHDQVVSDMRKEKNVAKLHFYSNLAGRGYPGPSAIIQGLDDFMQEETPNKGDILAG